jgi:signal transduction histidine kinase
MATPSEVSFGQLLYSGIAFMLLAGGALLSFFIAYQRRVLQQQLELQQVETQYQRQLLVATVEAQEGERERIGQDLHDSLGSALATAKLLVSRLRHGPTTESQTPSLVLLEEAMSTMVHDMRSISHNLYPAMLARFGLAEALQHLVDTCNEAGKLLVELRLHYRQSLDLAQELALYRICQELLTNALKHAQGATALAICLEQRETSLVLTVQDDGCGFAVPQPGPGAGLRSIAARVRLLQGTLSYPARPTPGSCTVVEIPTSQPLT